MVQRITVSNLQVAQVLHDLVISEILPGTDISKETFWQALEQCVIRFGPRNRELLAFRDQLQQKIDNWHRQNGGQTHNAIVYKQFLLDIGYLLAEGDDFSINTDHVDREISSIAAPQLVVPVTNARYALNATNARWGSLYDSLYGSNVIPEEGGADRGGKYNPIRGARVVEYTQRFLDNSVALSRGSHAQVCQYAIQNRVLVAKLQDDTSTGLREPEKLTGYRGEPNNPELILLCNNDLHIELLLDRSHPIGKTHPAGVKDIVLEAAVTTIQDLEDSVAAVDAEDKTLAYRNWLGLMKGDLIDTFNKQGKSITRHLNPDRTYLSPKDQTFTLPGRSLLLLRNVGHLMTNNAVLDAEGEEIPEGLLDAMMSGVIGLHDIKNKGAYKNSRSGSIYIVKPKMHGADEVRFTCEVFDFVEDIFKLPRYTIKLGIMDEERRTSLNLKECIRAAKDRVVFINTGFLDRTGDEIHTSMFAGPMIDKTAMKDSTWIKAYEDSNVDIGLRCGFVGKAEIGKGMWPMPDEMKNMVERKVSHPLAGANTAWVPSPTAAVLHALHYHRVNVLKKQQQLLQRQRCNPDNMLEIPLLDQDLAAFLSEDTIQHELDNNCQGILGYVVRWINQGVGCSKVPDIRNVGLMEDRATLRISSQHIANWLLHGICTEQHVMDTLKRMALKVDQQNAKDSDYRSMAPDFDNSRAFQAACDLIFKGVDQPNGYTEPLLYKHRLALKSAKP
ncbi:MAG: malate synthase G [Gammaproteobacteria bacterium]|nr:malate synthase G [Gammaproteobacteria bacterium]MDH5802575.1 malate synthase G [Gammaproteobacteria bacterium]